MDLPPCEISWLVLSADGAFSPHQPEIVAKGIGLRFFTLGH